MPCKQCGHVMQDYLSRVYSLLFNYWFRYTKPNALVTIQVQTIHKRTGGEAQCECE